MQALTCNITTYYTHIHGTGDITVGDMRQLCML